VSTAVALGLVADSVFPEPPNRFHPVAWFGSTMLAYEARFYRDSRPAGVTHAGVGLALGLGAGVALRRVLGRPASTIVAMTVATGGSMLRDMAASIARAPDLDAARGLLPSLVGRDTTGLTEAEMARAVIESVAENTVDAVVASAFWGVLLGAPGVFAHRALNTMDAMVGHHNDRYEHYGWASARLDDMAAWLPARLCAVAVAVVRPRRAAAIARAVRSDAPGHPSPNSGVAEAAFAAALGLRLGGTNRYGDRTEDRVILHAAGREPMRSDIAATNRLSRAVTVFLTTTSLALTVWSRRGKRRGLSLRTASRARSEKA
jgi:adenosylcobinamide-phosphate synthase